MADDAQGQDDELRRLLRRVRRLELRARSAVGDLAAGQYRSRFRGQGMEFDQVREYAVGDDVRSIDWNVTARAGRPFIKTFKEERELAIMLVVDCSGSMAFGGINPISEQSKSVSAAEAAAVLAITALRNQDKVGLIAFADKTLLHLPCRRGRNHTLRLVRELLATRAQRGGADPGHALDELRRVHRRRAVVFLISDFLDPPVDLGPSLQQAKRLHDVIGIRITDPAEEQLPAGSGPLVLSDPESGASTVLANGRRARRRYAEAWTTQRELIDSHFRSAGCELLEARTDQDVFASIKAYFRRRRSSGRG